MEEELKSLLSDIYTDILMLKEEIWEPDEDSCNSTIDNIERIAQLLNLEIKDTRDA